MKNWRHNTKHELAIEKSPLELPTLTKPLNRTTWAVFKMFRLEIGSTLCFQ